ncbi:MAG: signal recognition particle protein, partial [Firmicutes bacterium]|nr:signal recognition particle protein [Bacillota bacterium]
LRQIEAIISSMTPEERRNPEIIDGSRRRRIARGSGVRVQDVNALLRQFNQVKGLLKQFGGGGKAKRRAMRKGIIPFLQ